MVARNSTSSSSSSSSLLVLPRPHHGGGARKAAVSAVVVPFCRFSSACSSSSSQQSIGSTETANTSGKSSKGPAAAVSYVKRDVAAVQPRRRRVRFDYDENDSVRSTVHVYPKVSDAEKALCWNSKHDIQRMKQELHRETVDFVRRNPDYIGALEKLFNSPLSRHSSSSSSSSVSSSSASASTLQDFDKTEFVGSVMAREDAPRGLEYRMSFLIHRHKQWTTSTILQRQAQLKKEARLPTSSSKSSNDASSSHHRHWQVSEALARCCAHLSACTQQLAVEYARADALQAQSVYGDAFLSLCPM